MSKLTIVSRITFTIKRTEPLYAAYRTYRDAKAPHRKEKRYL